MFKSVKKLFTDKNSIITFNAERQCFKIDDNAKGQVWMLRFTLFCNIIAGAALIFNDVFSNYLGWFILVISIIFSIRSFLISSYQETIALESIQTVTYRRFSTSATGSIKFKNKTCRSLYHYDLSQLDNQIELFKSHGIEIKEKSSWF
ncbi:hypothetical protein [Nonlabens sp.]|uniref:hypothetical protein n=1 Tax=Nonlabens sp. TaxID=1888209 RepID=UPI0032667DD0